MVGTSSVRLSQQVALFRLLNMTANNLANMSTPGFKAQGMLFTEYLNKDKTNSEQISQVGTRGTYRNLSQGTLKQTFNKLDVAIQGDGYFKVQTSKGVRYTRAGSFALNKKGEITTKNGDIIMGSGGSALNVPANAADITISPDGTINSDAGSVGKFDIVTFSNLQNVVPVGNNLFNAVGDREQPVDNPRVEQGMIESSNVEPILEMNKMIELQRMFQATQNMIQSGEGMERKLINSLTRAN